MSPWTGPILFGAGLAAGFVDSIAGGGGLITVPVLLGTGLPPVEAFATNKLQSTFGSASAAWHYRRARLVPWSEAWPGVVATAVGAAAGVWAVSRMDPAVLRRVIPFLLLAGAMVVGLRPGLGQSETPARFRRVPFLVAAGFALGAYDGFFGPGTGTFWSLALVFGLGFGLLRATAWTKLMNFTSNAVALAAFLGATRIDWGAGLVMGAGQALGARLGARLALKGGAAVIRPVFLSVVVLVAGKLFYDGWWRGGG